MHLSDWSTRALTGTSMFGFPWALAWAAHTEDWSRVALLSRWLAGVGPSYPKTQPGLPTVAEFCKTTVFFPPFKSKTNDQFTKTGSGQTLEKLRN